MVTPATTVTLAPSVAPSSSVVPVSHDSLGRFHDRGKRSLVKVALGPRKQRSPTRTASQTWTPFLMVTSSPTFAPASMNTDSPRLQPAPTSAPAITCACAQTRVPAPTRAPSSTVPFGCTKYGGLDPAGSWLTSGLLAVRIHEVNGGEDVGDLLV